MPGLRSGAGCVTMLDVTLGTQTGATTRPGCLLAGRGHVEPLDTLGGPAHDASTNKKPRAAVLGRAPAGRETTTMAQTYTTEATAVKGAETDGATDTGVGASGTVPLWLRRPTLYPAELIAREGAHPTPEPAGIKRRGYKPHDPHYRNRPRRKKPVEIRFWSKAQKTDACWVWAAGKHGAVGYGSFKHAGRTRPAHRVAYELAHGPIPAGMVVRHACDNPSCVNPAHLALGTHADNVRDRVERGRSATGPRNGRWKGGHTLAKRATRRAAGGAA